MSHSKDPEKVAACNRYQVERHHRKQKEHEESLTTEQRKLYREEHDFAQQFKPSRWDKLAMSDPEKAKKLRAEYSAVVNMLKIEFPPCSNHTSHGDKIYKPSEGYTEYKVHMRRKF